MQKTYSKSPHPVKPGNADLRNRYSLLPGFGNFLFNALPFGLIWLAACWNTVVAALAAFFLTLFYCLRENYARNRALSEMAKKLKEQGNAQ